MYTFLFHSESGDFVVKHVTHARHSSGGSILEVSGQELLSHCFPLTVDLYLFGSDFSQAVSSSSFSRVEVRLEQ